MATKSQEYINTVTVQAHALSWSSVGSGVHSLTSTGFESNKTWLMKTNKSEDARDGLYSLGTGGLPTAAGSTCFSVEL